jgi:putative phosphoesterase
MNNNVGKKGALSIGVISDTHGILRPEAVEALHGVDLIIHAGDIGNPMIIDELGATAPVVAVRGNMDAEWAYKLPATEIVERNETLFYVLHDAHRLEIDPAVSGFRVVISGHTHAPSLSEHKGVLYLNPGSAGPCRSKLSPSVAVIRMEGEALDAQIIKIKD